MAKATRKQLSKSFPMTKASTGMRYGSKLRERKYHVEFHQDGTTLLVEVYKNGKKV